MSCKIQVFSKVEDTLYYAHTHACLNHMQGVYPTLVSCKIRVFPKVEDTLYYARLIESAGCSVLAVHGRWAIVLLCAVGMGGWVSHCLVLCWLWTAGGPSCCYVGVGG